MQYEDEGGICYEKTKTSGKKPNRAHPGFDRGGHAHCFDATVVVLVAGDRNWFSLRRNLAFEEMSEKQEVRA